MARLTEQEQQEVIRLIEAASPSRTATASCSLTTSARSSSSGTARPMRSPTSSSPSRSLSRSMSPARKSPKTPRSRPASLTPTAASRRAGPTSSSGATTSSSSRPSRTAQVAFHDVSYIEVKPHLRKNSVAVELTDFNVFYTQDSIKQAEESLKEKASKIVVDSGQIWKIAKDKNGIVTREQLTQSWKDWVDYWAVDFDYESKKEFIRKPVPGAEAPPSSGPDVSGLKPGPISETAAYEEVWTGDYIFENEWQSFRTKRDRSLEFTSVFKECDRSGPRKIAVKVVDIFGNDTMTIIDVVVGKK